MIATVVKNSKRVFGTLRRLWPVALLLCVCYVLISPASVVVETSMQVVQSPHVDSPAREVPAPPQEVQRHEEHAQPPPPPPAPEEVHCPPPPLDFALVMSTDEMNKVMLNRNWPILRGYENRDASEQNSPRDPLLLERLSMTMKTLKKPLLRIRSADGTVQERHDWKFEKIIHQTWRTDIIPAKSAPWVRKWLELNPDWSYVFWTDESAREFVMEHYPELLPVYDSWTVPVQRADMFRLIALYAFGGVYADIDVEPLKPLDEIREWSSCILSREPDLQTYVMVDDLNFWANNYTFTCNAFMACQSHHPFLNYILSRITKRSPMVTGQPCSLDQTLGCTGPFLMSLSYAFYRRSIPERFRQEHKQLDVICPEPEYFLPSVDGSRLIHAYNTCRRTNLSPNQQVVCDRWKDRGYKNLPLPQSFTNHRWFHTYHFNMQKRSINIHQIAKPLIWRQDTEASFFHVDYV